MQSVLATESQPRTVKRQDGTGTINQYFGIPGSVDMQPQAFLVELPYAGARVNPHFHDIDQFQVVVAGDGRIGKRPLSCITFQYADAYTPYGPIVANGEGISFFTLRNVASGGHFVMPGSRHLMPCRAGRNIAGTFDVSSLLSHGHHTQHLMAVQGDGVGAWGVSLGPRASTSAPDNDGGGQYLLVCAGSLVHEERVLDANALVRIEPGDASPVLHAGPGGAAVLVLQFARPSKRPGSDPERLAARAEDGYLDLRPKQH